MTKPKQWKVLFIACCPVSIKIANLLKELCKFDQKGIIYKIYDFTHGYLQLLSIIRVPSPNLFKKIGTILRSIISNRYVLQAKYIISHEQPDLIIVGDDGGICASIIKYCRIVGIPTVTVQVGLLSETSKDRLLNFLRMKDYLIWRVISRILSNKVISKVLLFINSRLINLEWGTSGADRILVASDYYKKLLIKRGVPVDRITVTGYLLTDEIYYFYKHRQSKLKGKCSAIVKELSINSTDKCTITILTQPLVEDAYCTLHDYLLVLKELLLNIPKDYNVIIKLHPRESSNKYDMLLSDISSRRRITIVKDLPLLESINIADICITFYSTTGLIALLMGKPLITLDVFKIPYMSLYSEYKFNIKDLSQVGTILETLKKRNFKIPKNVGELLIRKHFHIVDGKVHRRILDIILRILRDKNR